MRRKNIALAADHIQKVYGNQGTVTRALNDISFEVGYGEYISIMGPSGSGKTTLLNCVSTIDTVSSGHIFLDGKDITALDEEETAEFRRKNLGFVFQDFNLLDTLTLEENIALPLTLARRTPSDIKKRVGEVSEKLQIANVLEKFPYQVSGGQKQRCAFARAVAGEPKLIMADEPTGALDFHSSCTLLEIMEKFNREQDTTILMVTHDAFCASFAKRIMFVRDGRIFNEIHRGGKTRELFYHEILDVLSAMGGDKIC